MADELSLKVRNLIEKLDYGTDIARISEEEMKKIGIEEADVIEIEGKRKTYAIALKACPSDAGSDIARIDELVRKNCKADITDKIKIRKADVKEAKAVIVAPARKGISIHISGELLRRNILMRPVAVGDIIMPNPILRQKPDKTSESIFEDGFLLTPFGAEKFAVVATYPESPARITKDTEVVVMPNSVEDKNVF